MAMTREQMDEWDRIMMGQPAQQPITPPVSYQPQPSPPVFDAEGRPITRSASFDDIRRFLGFGNRAAPAPSVDAAEMYQQLRPASTFPVPPGGEAPSPSIPYMPSTDPRGAAAPIPAPPRPTAPARPRLPVMGGVPSEADMQFAPARPDTFGGVSPTDMFQFGRYLFPAPLPQPTPAAPPAPVALANPNRPSPQQLAEILRGRGMPSFPAPTSPGWESQISGAPMAAEPVMRMRR